METENGTEIDDGLFIGQKDQTGFIGSSDEMENGYSPQKNKNDNLNSNGNFSINLSEKRENGENKYLENNENYDENENDGTRTPPNEIIGKEIIINDYSSPMKSVAVMSSTDSCDSTDTFSSLINIEKGLKSVRKKRKKSKKPQSLKEMIADKSIRFLSTLYTYFCFVIMFVDESFPLWAVTSVEKGGLSWSSAQVGSALASVGE